FVFLLLSISLFAQDIVTGKITDQKGEALIGATVLESGTKNGTVTDVEGNFSISLTSATPVLKVSFIGYITAEVPVNGQTVINVSLEDDIQQLQEIVVVGYGVEKRVNLSGAVDQVNAEQLEARPISNISQGLQGVIPNLNIDFFSGEPGAAANINIRGITSINGGNPLILIDGVPSESMELNRLSPQDIESISVIKDASAAAIYGARAAFGVIIITTKSGESEGVSISYSGNTSWDKPTVLPNKITDPYIYLRVRETSTDNTPWDNQNYSDQTYQYARDRSDNPSGTPGVRTNPTDPSSWEYMGDRDWTDYFLGDYSISQNHQLALSGRSKTTQYYLSGSYNKQNGALKLADDYFDRYSVRSKVTFKPYEWLSVGNNTFINSTTREKPSYLSIWDLYNFHPTDWDKNPDGTWANTDVGYAGARLTDGGRNNERYGSFQTRFTTEMSFLDDMLKFNSDFTYRKGNTNYNYYTTKYKVGYGPDDVREVGNNSAYRGTEFEDYSVFNAYATFRKSFNGHNLTAIAGYNQEYYRSEWFMAAKDKVISASLPTIALATGNSNVDEYIADWAVRGVFFRANYIYNDKYILEFNGRYDGTSRFPKENRFGFFPSASAAWRIDQESFMSSVDVISSLKLRGSYGSLGNQSVSEYGYIPTMQSSQSNYLIGGALPQRVTPPSLVSSNYTWEEVKTFNFGAEIGILGDQLYTTFDVFNRNTLGMLTLGKDLPDVLGASEPLENAADLETKGWELSINYKNNLNVAGKSLVLNTKFVLSDSRSFITSFDNPNGNLTQYYEGMEFGEIWGLQSDGLFQSQSEIDNLDESSLIPWGALDIVPGWPKYKDLDGNGAIEKGTTLEDPKDMSVIGNVSPRYRYGVNLSADWNGFDLSIFMQGIGKRDYYPLDYLYWGFYQQPYAGGYEHLLDFYRAADESSTDRARHSQSYIDAGLADQNLDAEYPILQSWMADRNLGERIDQSKGLAIPQTRYMLSSAYLRLKNLTVGYSLPTSVIERLGLAKVRVYFSGENLTEWSQVKAHYDPESLNDNQTTINPAESTSRSVGKGYAYPLQRRFAMGLNINF
ncbi:MAG: TonB-dependent receptor, partial [Cyclobacteriaceae bacterium]|nr:TonB-dependent receptor [Cyclobacteriaceae bacterium]